MKDHLRLKRVAALLAREVLVICVAAGVILFGLREFNSLRDRPAANPTQEIRGPLLSVGSKVALRGADFSRAAVSLILIASPTCHYCAASLGFHSRLRVEAENHQRPFYVLVPDLARSADYMKGIGVGGGAGREWKDLGLHVAGTPTLAAVDAAGVIRRVWIGRVPVEVEDEILGIVRTPGLLVFARSGEKRNRRNYQLAELETLVATNKVQLVIPRERDEVQADEGGITMPVLEMPVRAPIELSRDRLQVIDCSSINSGECDSAVLTLSSLKFQVATLGAGSVYQSCSITEVKPR